MTALLVLLGCTNLITAAALVRLLRSRSAVPVREVAELLGDGPPPVGTGTRTRRVITIEILNPLELAAHRGRVAGIAGSLAPGLVGRMVHDQTFKRLKQELAAQRVAAEVRLHTLRPVVVEPVVAQPVVSEPVAAEPVAVEPAEARPVLPLRAPATDEPAAPVTTAQYRDNAEEPAVAVEPAEPNLPPSP